MNVAASENASAERDESRLTAFARRPIGWRAK
jgi:hypothetical protein